jgi:hypothetical protein
VTSVLLVYHLEFSEPSLLQSAFALLSDAKHVESCTVEPEVLRLRFLAPRGHAEELVEVLASQGGLRWCSRHPLASGS